MLWQKARNKDAAVRAATQIVSHNLQWQTQDTAKLGGKAGYVLCSAVDCDLGVSLIQENILLVPRFFAEMLSVVVIVGGANVASGQDYPNRPIRIVTSAAGGDSDFNTRIVAQGISGPLGQPVIVDNRTGILAAEAVSKAPPDGYTLTVQTDGLWTRSLLAKMPYDAERDFSPISLISRGINVLIVHPSLPVKSVRELIALAKAKPGQLNYSSVGVGSSSHIAVELFNSMAGVNIVRITYKATAQALTDVISGQVQLTINDIGLVAPHVKAGKLRALAITSGEPSVLAPGLPTVAASGVPGYAAATISGILAPAKTPAAIVNRLSQEVVRVLNQPDVKERFLNAGIETVGSSPAQFAAFIKSDITKMGKVINDAGLKAN